MTATAVVLPDDPVGRHHRARPTAKDLARAIAPPCAMLALAWLAVTRAALADDSGQALSSANEIRRMFTALCGPPREDQHARHWSRWRHQHQQRARHSHYKRQRLQDH
jgi:hypothetical protein